MVDVGAEFHESVNDSMQVVEFCLHHHVDVLGDVVNRSVQHPRDTADCYWGRAQPQVSRLERLDLRVAQVDTIASYISALGGTPHLTIELRGARFDLPITPDNEHLDPAA